MYRPFRAEKVLTPVFLCRAGGGIQSTRDEFKGIYLHVQIEKTDIRVSVKWEHTGFPRDADRRHRKSLELLRGLARWFGQRSEKDDAAGAMQDSGIRSLEDALAGLPVEE